MWQHLHCGAQPAKGLSPITMGDLREFFVLEFLTKHLPAELAVGKGHVFCQGSVSQQIDGLVYRKSGLALPMGNANMVMHTGLVACVEVKSTLKRLEFRDQIVPMFKAMPSPQPLKVIVTQRLEGTANSRSILKKWADELSLTTEALPDIVLILENAAIVRGGILKSLESTSRLHGSKQKLYKFGHWKEQNWMGLMLLVFELAHRVGGEDGPNWASYINKHLAEVQFKELGTQQD